MSVENVPTLFGLCDRNPALKSRVEAIFKVNNLLAQAEPSAELTGEQARALLSYSIFMAGGDNWANIAKLVGSSEDEVRRQKSLVEDGLQPLWERMYRIIYPDEFDEPQNELALRIVNDDIILLFQLEGLENGSGLCLRRSKGEVVCFDQAVKWLRERGLSYKETAECLRSDISEIRESVHRLILSGKITPAVKRKAAKRPPEIVELDNNIKQLLNEGWDYEQIATEFGISKVQIADSVRRLRDNNQIPNKGLTEEEKNYLTDVTRTLRDRGWKQGDILNQVVRPFLDKLGPARIISRSDVARATLIRLPLVIKCIGDCNVFRTYRSVNPS